MKNINRGTDRRVGRERERKRAREGGIEKLEER